MIRKITLDDAQILLRHYAQDHPAHQALVDHAENLGGVYSDGTLRAVWTHWVDSLHPGLLTFAAAFARDVTDYSRVGVQVLAELMAEAGRMRGLMFADTVPASDFGRWLLTQDFRAVMLSTATRLDLQNLQLPGSVPPQAGQVLTGRAVMRDDQLAQQFLNLTWQQFDDTQRAVPIEDYDEETWSRVVLDRLLTTAPLVLLQDGTVQAYGLLRRNAAGELLLGWKWAANLDAMRQFLPAVITFAQNTGAPVLNGVFASNSECDQLVWDLLPWQPAPTRNLLVRMNAGLDQDDGKTGRG
ncbi:MAG: hypothetical protein LKG24_01920 [Lacticaseibacillus songhuajiangensis]|jgi:hypothetical protein|nr:hypothetical protein [Lacticaseibacillus songhuajiangensis]